VTSAIETLAGSGGAFKGSMRTVPVKYSAGPFADGCEPARSPDYLARCPAPRTPRDLTEHECINLRLPAKRGMYAWEFERNGREFNVRVDGRLAFNTASLMLKAALEGFGLAYFTEQQVSGHLDRGALVRVLTGWCPPFAGYHLYYPSRRQPSAAFAVLVEALRYRPARGEQKS
jgi:DNA-binding transcriptional LysR family regulator